MMPMSQRSDGSWYYCPPEDTRADDGTLDLPKRDKRAVEFIYDDVAKNVGKATRSKKVPIENAYGDGEE